MPTIRCLALLCLSGCLWRGEATDLSGYDLRLTVLHTSDIHSRLFPFELAPNAGDRSLGLDEGNAPFGGVARLGYLLKRERTRADRVLHVDSGDCFQGAPVFNEFMGAPELRFQSMIGLDAAVIGNHEFDSGVEAYVQQLDTWATYDNVAANYAYPDGDNPNNHTLGDLSQPFGLYNLKGLRVAVIGMGNLGSLTSIGEGGNSLKLAPLEQNEIVRSYVNLLHASVDLIFVLSHLGLDEDQELLRGYEKVVWKDRVQSNWSVVEDLGDGRVVVKIPGVSGIDVVFGGHLHVVLNPPLQVQDPDGREVPIVHSGAFSKFLGRFDMVLADDSQFGGKRVVAHKYQVFPVDERLAAYEDADVAAMLEPYLLDMRLNLDLRKVIGFAPQTITRFSKKGNGDSGLGNLVAESMRLRRRVEAEFSVTNTLGIRDSFYAGPITLEDMYNVFPFENALTVMYLSEHEVQELVDYITYRSASRGCNAQAQVAGISFTMNCGQVLNNERDPESYQSPGEDIAINDVPLAAGKMYKVATNDYIANGGSGFRVLKRNTTKINTGISLRDALVDYMQTFKTCARYEAEDARYCDRSDQFSQSICIQVGGVGRIPGQPGAKGAYADVPCVVSDEDGRIKRKTSDKLDEVTDEAIDEVQP